jgi:AraC-like DNA-binding protein
MGEQKRIQPILTAIFPPEMLSQGGFRQMFYSIRGQVVTAVNHLGATELGEVPDFDALQTNQELLTSLSTYMDSLCTFVNASRISHNNLLIENVLRYIQENYPNSSLNADLIADEFGISAKYVSQLVRSQTGKTYTEYVENMRLTQAMDLLENSETPVTQVAVAVGFLSQNTFYKSFRRVYNMSPTEYRAKQSH